MRRSLFIAHVNDTGEARPDDWARLAGTVRELRVAGRCDLLLHAGDVNLSTTAGPSAVALLNWLRVDAVGLGNHDLDGGRSHTIARYSRERHRYSEDPGTVRSARPSEA